MLTQDKAPKYNAEGYTDPTMHQALQNMEDEDNRFNAMIKSVKTLIRLCGYELCERIACRDTKTGREYR